MLTKLNTQIEKIKLIGITICFLLEAITALSEKKFILPSIIVSGQVNVL
jgi:hypothetical protein